MLDGTRRQTERDQKNHRSEPAPLGVCGQSALNSEESRQAGGRHDGEYIFTVHVHWTESSHVQLMQC